MVLYSLYYNCLGIFGLLWPLFQPQLPLQLPLEQMLLVNIVNTDKKLMSDHMPFALSTN